MQLTLEISNADENLLQALKDVINLYPHSKLKVYSSDEIYTKDFIDSIKEAEREYEEEEKNGTLKIFTNINDLRKDLLS